MRFSILFCIACSLFAQCALSAEWGMKTGDPGLRSAGPLAFGSNGVLFVGDTKSATVVAIDTHDKSGSPNEVDLHVDNIDKEVAAAVGADKVTINDLAVNPASGIGYMSVSVGEEGKPALVKLLPNGKVEHMPTEKVDFAKVELPNAPADKMTEGRRPTNLRNDSITDLAFSEGKVFVSGVAAKGESNVRELVFPFHEADKGVNVEIYHGAHGKYETTRSATVRTFIPFKIDGEPHLLAGFQCTPLVKFPLDKFEAGGNVRGTTLAELGNRNRPLDMIVYKQDGKDYLLLSNTARGVMKISTEDIEREEGITEKIGGTAGQSYDTIESLKNVEQMDRLNDAHVLVLAKSKSGALNAHTVELP